MEEGYLCGSVHEWQRERVRCIDENDFPYADMAWRVEGKIMRDIRHAYMNSIFMTTLFRTCMKRDVEYIEEDGIHVYSVDEKFAVFESIRVFCHTGLVRFCKGETILKTLERYTAFHMYDIEGGKTVLRKLIMDNLTPGNATQAFEYAIHRDDADLLRDINEYIVNYAFVIFKHKTFGTLRMESMSYLANLCMENKLNIKEPDLLDYMYKLCEKKLGEKEFEEFKTPIEILKHRFGEVSLWEAIRVTNISMKEFMGFVNSHDACMDNNDIVRVMKTIYSSENDSELTPRKRKKFQMISSYPRNLNIGDTEEAQGDVTHWDRDKVQMFFVFDASGKKDKLALPPILFQQWRLRCSVYVDKSLRLKGTVITDDDDRDDIIITTKFVNFRHDRWKKSTVRCKPKHKTYDFDMPNMLSWGSIEGPGAGGYMFDMAKYPDYVDNGTWLMMSMTIERDVESNKK